MTVGIDGKVSLPLGAEKLSKNSTVSHNLLLEKSSDLRPPCRPEPDGLCVMTFPPFHVYLQSIRGDRPERQEVYTSFERI